MESIDELAVKLKGDVGNWEKVIFNWACSLAQEVAKALLESIDEELMKRKDDSLKQLSWHWGYRYQQRWHDDKTNKSYVSASRSVW